MTTSDENRIFAKFMGMECKEYHGYDTEYDWTNCPPDKHWPCKEPPPFDTSWDWIIPVVEKIESLPEGFIVPIHKTSCSIIMNGKSLINPPIHKQASTKFKAVYDAVFEFINWYNSYKSNLEYETGNS